MRGWFTKYPQGSVFELTPPFRISSSILCDCNPSKLIRGSSSSSERTVDDGTHHTFFSAPFLPSLITNYHVAVQIDLIDASSLQCCCIYNLFFATTTKSPGTSRVLGAIGYCYLRPHCRRYQDRFGPLLHSPVQTPFGWSKKSRPRTRRKGRTCKSTDVRFWLVVPHSFSHECLISFSP